MPRLPVHGKKVQQQRITQGGLERDERRHYLHADSEHSFAHCQLDEGRDRHGDPLSHPERDVPRVAQGT